MGTKTPEFTENRIFNILTKISLFFNCLHLAFFANFLYQNLGGLTRGFIAFVRLSNTVTNSLQPEKFAAKKRVQKPAQHIYYITRSNLMSNSICV